MLWSCANYVAPSGGIEDKIPPILDTISPPQGTLNFNRDEIVFHFDEFLKPGTYTSSVFVSPVMPLPPKVTVSGKRLIIKFLSPLKPSTTYVVNISTEIADFNAGNKIAEPISYAFSTGDRLDSLHFSGFVTDPITGEAEKDFTLLLFPKEDLVGDSVFKVKPLYAAISGSSGEFRFSFLKPGKYLLAGVKDADHSFSISDTKEKIAVGHSFEVQLDSNIKSKIPLYSFYSDKDPAVPRSAKWLSDKIFQVDFREKIPFIHNGDSLLIYISDTSGNGKQPIKNFAYNLQNPAGILIYPGRDRSEFMNIYFENLSDSLGNQRDTFIRISPENKAKILWKNRFSEPVYDQPGMVIRFNSALPLRQYFEDSLIVLKDSSGINIQIKYISENLLLSVFIEPGTAGTPPFELSMKPGIPFRDGTVLDSLLTFTLKFGDPSQLGSLSGTVLDTVFKGNWKILLFDESKDIIASAQGPDFKFPNLSPGKYFLTGINDKDQNGVWTPGKLFPLTPPEEVFIDPSPIDIRPRWDVENYKFVIKKESLLKVSKTSAGPSPMKKN